MSNSIPNLSAIEIPIDLAPSARRARLEGAAGLLGLDDVLNDRGRGRLSPGFVSWCQSGSPVRGGVLVVQSGYVPVLFGVIDSVPVFVSCGPVSSAWPAIFAVERALDDVVCGGFSSGGEVLRDYACRAGVAVARQLGKDGPMVVLTTAGLTVYQAGGGWGRFTPVDPGSPESSFEVGCFGGVDPAGVIGSIVGALSVAQVIDGWLPPGVSLRYACSAVLEADSAEEAASAQRPPIQVAAGNPRSAWGPASIAWPGFRSFPQLRDFLCSVEADLGGPAVVQVIVEGRAPLFYRFLP